MHTEKGKPVERQGRKTADLRSFKGAMIAGIPKYTLFLFLIPVVKGVLMWLKNSILPAYLLDGSR